MTTRTTISSNQNAKVWKLFAIILLLLLSGCLSTYFYCKFFRSGGVLFPGILYTSTTFLIFLITKTKLQLRVLTIYFVLMILTYLLIWLLTIASMWFVVFFGPVTSGIGTIATFLLTDKFIRKIKYDRVHVILIGAVAFILTEVLHYAFINVFEATPTEYFLNVEFEPGIIFSELFIFWHVMLGTKLYLALSTSNR